MARQAGMTLIELTVVLLVLIGLAGLLIPYVSGFVSKTHDSTGASNIQAVNNAVQRYAVEHYDNFPNKMDSLIETSDSSIFPKMMGEMMGMSYLTPLPLDKDKAASLSKVGINKIMLMDKSLANATFANTTGYTSVATGTVVAELTGAPLNDLSSRMGKPTDTNLNHYVVFGLGDDSTIAGATVSDVPVHFAQNADMGANNAYNHFVLLFEVPKQDYCNVDDYKDVATLNTDSDAFVVADPADIDQATALGVNEAACSAYNGVSVPDTVAAASDGSLGAWTSQGAVWVEASAKAKYVGAAMAMGMGNFEGQGEAINRYYENTATN